MGEENCSNIESWKWQVEGEALRDFKRVKKVQETMKERNGGHVKSAGSTNLQTSRGLLKWI